MLSLSWTPPLPSLLLFIIPWRTSVSSFVQLTRTWTCPFCTCELSPALEDHLGSGQSTKSKSTTKPVSTGINHHFSRSLTMVVLIDSKETKAQTLDMVRAGLHCSLRISRQMLPLLLMFGWYTLVLKDTCNNQAHTFVNKQKDVHLT